MQLKLISIAFLVSIFEFCQAQPSRNLHEPPPPPPPILRLEGDSVYSIVPQKPFFPAGDLALNEFLQKQIRYPKLEKDNNVQGKVLIRFAVTENGGIENIAVVKSVSPNIDSEAVRIASMLPDFSPGLVWGKPVKAYFNLPILFKIQLTQVRMDSSISNKIDRDENFRNAIGQYQYQKWMEAIKYLSKSMETYPYEYYTYELLADCYLRIGEYQYACDTLFLAVELGSPTALESAIIFCD